MDIVRTLFRMTENPCIDWVWGIPYFIFLIRYEDSYRDVHIRPVPV